MSLSYLRDYCHKQPVTHIRESRWFESMYTLQGKTDQHATYFPRSVHICSKTIRILHGPHIATFCIIVNNDGQRHFREKRFPIQSTARRLVDPWVRIQFLSRASHWRSGGKVTLGWWQITRLTGPINTSMRLVCSILGRGGQPIGP
jgi:hypothetical protein